MSRKLEPINDKEEYKKHVHALNEITNSKTLLEAGHKEGLISKSQMKAGLAAAHNAKLEYVLKNRLEIFMGHIYKWSEEEEY